jgi:hypothetical protein
LTIALGRLRVGDVALFVPCASALSSMSSSSLSSSNSEVVYEAVTRVAGTLPRSLDEFALLRHTADDDDESKSSSSQTGATAAAAAAGGAASNDDDNPVRYFLDANARSAFAHAIGRRQPIVGEVICVGDIQPGSLAPTPLAFLQANERFSLVICCL